MSFTQFSLLLGVGSWVLSCMFPGSWHLKNEMNMHTDHRIAKILYSQKAKAQFAVREQRTTWMKILQSPDYSVGFPFMGFKNRRTSLACSKFSGAKSTFPFIEEHDMLVLNQEWNCLHGVIYAKCVVSSRRVCCIFAFYYYLFIYYCFLGSGIGRLPVFISSQSILFSVQVDHAL